MSDFIHAREHLQGGSAVRVDCDHQCNVMLLDDRNFQLYRRGGQYEYFGGFFERLPAIVGVPHTGWWNTVIDLGGGRANIRYGISYVG